MSDKKETAVKPAESKAKIQIDALVKNGLEAATQFELLNQSQVDLIVSKCAIAGIDNHGVLAEKAISETKRGVFEDKATKNLFACEYVVNNLRNLKTAGLIDKDDVTGISRIACPVGVICAVTPVTNPTSTVIFKSLIALKTRNPIIFGFHPSAQQCSKAAAQTIYEAAVKAGAPKNCIQWVEEPSIEATNLLMNHDGVATILATGGNAMVKAAYSCGKPALGVGAGNVPSYIEKTANIRQAVNDIVLSKAFDNGMICASEQAIIIDKEIYSEAISEFKKYGVYFTTQSEKAKVENFAFGVEANSKNCGSAALNAAIVGMHATEIATKAGFNVPSKCTIIASECKEVGPCEPLTREKLSPVLAILKSDSTEHGIELAAQMVEFNGLGHSAAIHTADDNIAIAFGERVKAMRVLRNQPSTFGGIGNVYNSLIPSLTLGCGSYGKNSVGDNVSAVNLINIKKLANRRNIMQWFKVPAKMYFERNSIQYLQQMEGVKSVVIVTDQAMVKLGFVNKITEQLTCMKNQPAIQVFADVEPDPDITTVNKGLELIKKANPDTIIALGGGSAMDAAKGMWLFYEHPEVEFDDIKQKFMDIRKRAVKLPQEATKSKLICIPTTSGTGSEVTPFAVISDKANEKKYPLADYALTPSIAIIDAEFTKFLPSAVVADTGMDVLTHAIEAYVSILASDYTDGLALNAIENVFEYLERSYSKGSKDLEAQEKMHNAATIAGMAFANAFLGANHSLAHKIGAVFHVPHGKANAILLPHIIRYNGVISTKLNPWPKNNYYQADEKYAKIAKRLGLTFKTNAEGVEALAKAVEKLAKSIGMQKSFKECGIDKQEWEANINKIAMLAFEDQCSPANPKVPVVKDLEAILKKAY